MKVSQLFVYPIKSCKGVAVNEADLTMIGLRHDRQFILVDSKGHFLSQRRIPAMSLIEMKFEKDLLTVSGPDQFSSIAFELDGYSGPKIEVDIWMKTGYGIDMGNYAAEWFSDHLGISCRLLGYDYTAENLRRRKPTESNPEGIPLSFADGFPVLLISVESLADLNGLLANSVTMERFRPNIVVTGARKPFAEDEWRQAMIGSTYLVGEKLCERCSVPLTDPKTGIADKREPLATLKTYRKIPSAPGRKAGAVVFGKNLSVDQPGILRIGDEVIAD